MAASIARIQSSLHTLKSKLDGGSVDDTFLDEITDELRKLDEEIRSECDSSPECWKMVIESNADCTAQVKKALYARTLEIENSILKTYIKSLELDRTALVQEALSAQYTLEKKNTVLKTYILSQESKSNTLQDELKTAIARIKYLQSEINKRQAIPQLVQGQIAHNIEKAVLEYVLHDTIGPNQQIKNINDMEQAISHGVEGSRKAEQKWDALKQDIGWTDDLLKYIRKLKRCRIDIAHPKVDEYTLDDVLSMGNVTDEALLTNLLEIREKLRNM